MKRDMDLVRAILIVMEKSETTRFSESDIQIEGRHPQEMIDYHICIMKDAGLLEGKIQPYPGGWSFDVRLAWLGHEFLDAFREDTRWNRTKGLLAKAGERGFEIIVETLARVSLEQLKGTYTS